MAGLYDRFASLLSVSIRFFDPRQKSPAETRDFAVVLLRNYNFLGSIHLVQCPNLAVKVVYLNSVIKTMTR